MKILIGHNRYQWRGGEDAVLDAESRLLKDAGHDVYLFEAHNDSLQKASTWQKISLIPQLIWSKSSYDRLRREIDNFKPDVAHFHNIYYTLTPSVYDACRDARVPVVQSLHNFRMLCANGLFFRDGRVCEDCLTRSSFEGIRHACYRESVMSSAGVVAMTSYHRHAGTWRNKVNMFITATEFSRQKYIHEGIDASKIMVKSNVVYPDIRPSPVRGEYALFVGRLSEEKGVKRLIEAWKEVPNIPLKIMGQGPLGDELKKLVQEYKIRNIDFLGFVDQKDYDHYMRGAKFIIIPSQCYDNFPLTAVEGFAYGLPVLASRIGTLQEVIVEGVNGYFFDPFSPNDLARCALATWQKDLSVMSAQVRKMYDEYYSPAVNVARLLEIYQVAMAKQES